MVYSKGGERIDGGLRGGGVGSIDFDDDWGWRRGLVDVGGDKWGEDGRETMGGVWGRVEGIHEFDVSWSEKESD